MKRSQNDSRSLRFSSEITCAMVILYGCKVNSFLVSSFSEYSMIANSFLFEEYMCTRLLWIWSEVVTISAVWDVVEGQLPRRLLRNFTSCALSRWCANFTGSGLFPIRTKLRLREVDISDMRFIPSCLMVGLMPTNVRRAREDDSCTLDLVTRIPARYTKSKSILKNGVSSEMKRLILHFACWIWHVTYLIIILIVIDITETKRRQIHLTLESAKGWSIRKFRKSFKLLQFLILGNWHLPFLSGSRLACIFWVVGFLRDICSTRLEVNVKIDDAYIIGGTDLKSHTHNHRSPVTDALSAKTWKSRGG